MKSLSLETSIDKKDYYMRKVVAKFDMEGDTFDTTGLMLGGTTALPEKANAKVAFVVKFGDFGKELTATKPSESITSEDFLNSASEIIQKHYLNLQQENSNTSLPRL